jgi:hypothetical protein
LRVVGDASRPIPPPLGIEPRYSEQDVADFRRDWQHDAEKRSWESQLSRFEGQLTGFRDSMRSIAREVVLDVLKQERQEHEQAVAAKWTRREKVAAILQAVTFIVVALIGLRSLFH